MFCSCFQQVKTWDSARRQTPIICNLPCSWGSSTHIPELAVGGSANCSRGPASDLSLDSNPMSMGWQTDTVAKAELGHSAEHHTLPPPGGSSQLILEKACPRNGAHQAGVQMLAHQHRRVSSRRVSAHATKPAVSSGPATFTVR